MAKEINKTEFLRLIKAVYNQHHNQLSQDLKAELLAAAKELEADGSLGLTALRLNRFVTAEIRYHNLGLTAPKELVDLSSFLQKAAADYKKWSGLL